MRLLSFLCMASLFLFASCSTTSQVEGLTKEEVKEWEDKAKQYQKNPEALKALVESQELYREEADSLRAKANELQAKINQYENRITQLEQENMQLTNNVMTAEQTIQQLSDENEELTARGPERATEEDMSGTIFRVQIGAFEKTRVPEALAAGENMQLEEAEGMQKVLVGKFRNFEDAKQLMTYLQRMGVKGAWVVPFIDGQRVPLKEALQQEEQQQ
jgi:septal ring factor EnvC (AmiA/AmiB activator)